MICQSFQKIENFKKRSYCFFQKLNNLKNVLTNFDKKMKISKNIFINFQKMKITKKFGQIFPKITNFTKMTGLPKYRALWKLFWQICQKIKILEIVLIL